MIEWMILNDGLLIKASRASQQKLRFVGNDVELVTTKQSQLVNDWMLTGSVACLRNVYLNDDAKDNIREMLQDLMLQWIVDGDEDTLRTVIDAVRVTQLRVEVPKEARVDVAERLALLIQIWLTTKVLCMKESNILTGSFQERERQTSDSCL